MYKTESKKIDGFDCSMTSLDFFTQGALKRRLIIPIMKQIPSLLDGGMDSEFDFSKLADILEMFDEDSYKELETLVLKNCKVNGCDMSDSDIAGMTLSSHTVLFYKLVWFFLEVNYSDFLEVIRTTLEKYGMSMEKTMSKLKPSSPTTKKSSAKR
jgi:hypothetical protein